jgi:hypothetical protein
MPHNGMGTQAIQWGGKTNLYHYPETGVPRSKVQVRSAIKITRYLTDVYCYFERNNFQIAR